MIMTAHTLDAKSPSQKLPMAIATLRTPKEAAQFLKLSTSWLAKARMRGDGPPYIKFGRAIRYSEADLLQWISSQRRSRTSKGNADQSQKSTEQQLDSKD
jgi:predicted DNA-binding transcriptional regulator AlpA